MNTVESLFITRIEVRKLFGFFDYILERSPTGDDPGRVAILYGDNGSGKTTILSLVFHLLAPEGQSGHKTAVARIPFSFFSINLSDGSQVSAERNKDNIIGEFTLKIKRKRKSPESFRFPVDDKLSVNRTLHSEEERKEIARCLVGLKELNLGLYLLADDRTIALGGRARLETVEFTSDLEDESYLEMLLRRARSLTKFERRADRRNEEPLKQAELLAMSMERFTIWIKNLALQASSAGDSSVNTLYNEVLTRVAQSSVYTETTKPDSKELHDRIKSIQLRSKALARYGLVPEFKGENIISQLNSVKTVETISVMTEVLTPYIESLERRLDTLRHTYEIVDNLVTIVNGFLSHKKVTFHVHEGLNIITNKGASLTPYNLSSGERHLLLIFCNASTAMEHPSIFIVDEPELSLNIKWQRYLISSLCKTIGNNPVQYIFATHSLEIISQYRDRVLQLTPMEERG